MLSMLSQGSVESMGEERVRVIRVLDHLPGGMSYGELQFLSGIPITVNYKFTCETGVQVGHACLRNSTCDNNTFIIQECVHADMYCL